MSALNWSRAQKDSKRKTSIADEKDWRGKDAAARWLDRNERKPTRKPRPNREAASAS